MNLFKVHGAKRVFLNKYCLFFEWRKNEGLKEKQIGNYISSANFGMINAHLRLFAGR